MNIKLELAVQHIRSSGVIAYPTEGVWGLGCDPYDESAVCRLLNLKQRPSEKGLILVGSNLSQVNPLLKTLTAAAKAQCESTWPGPHTWILPDPEGLIPSWIKGKHSGVAVRISNHPLVAQLCEAWGGLLVSTSANFAQQAPARYVWQVAKRFSGHIYILPGQLGGLVGPSPIRQAVTGRVVR